MTELHFPGGPVAIDEGRVWTRVSAWLGASRTTREVRMRAQEDGRFVVMLSHETGAHIGRSALGLPDAAAQALQIAENDQ
jgi:hypothetical protein